MVDVRTLSTGMDLSLTATAVVTLSVGPDDDAVIVEKITRLETPASKIRGMERISSIRTQVLDHIQAADPAGDGRIVIEGYSFGSRGRSVIDLGELGGVVRYALYAQGKHYIEIPPAQAKKFATGSGVAEKSKIMLATYKRWGFEPQTDDEADAYILARIGLVLNHPGLKPSLIAPQKAVIAEILKKLGEGAK